MRVENDGKIHIFAPTTTGTTYDYEYSLASGHPFFSKVYRKRLVIPNYIVVKSQTNDDPQYSGYAIDTDSNDLIPKRAYYETRLASNAQATAIAEALLLVEQLWSEAGSADVPLNIGAEIWDYVKVTDERESDCRVGNLGHLTRHWNAAKREWRMTFSFGNWMTTKKALANLDPSGSISSDDLEAYFTRLRVKDAYVEHLLIDQLDIVMDDIPDGSVYGKIKSVHLDAGGLVINEYASYAVGYDPSGKRRTFTATPTTPYDCGRPLV